MRQSMQKNLFGIQYIQSMENAKIDVGRNSKNCSDLATHLLSLEYRRRQKMQFMSINQTESKQENKEMKYA